MNGDKTRKALATYDRLIRYSFPYSFRLMAALVFGLVYAGANGALLWATKNAFHLVFKAPGEALVGIVFVGLAFPLIAIARGLGDYASNYFIRWVGNRVVMDIRNQAFARTLDLSVSFFSRSRTGELISRITNDSMLIERAVSQVIADIVKQPFTLFAMVGWLFWLDARLAVASLILVPLCIIPIRYFGRRIRRHTREGQERIADLMSILQEAINGIRIVKAFGMEDYERQRFRAQNKVFFGRTMRVTVAKAIVEPIIVVMASVGVGLVLIYAHSVHMAQEDFITYAMALFMMYEPIKKLGNVHLVIQESSGAADRIFELLDAPITVTDSPRAIPFKDAVRTVEFERVSFSYEKAPVLNDISFTVNAGTRMAIVGGSGAGKTTLVNLLPRFADVSSGRILINGADIREFTLASLRKSIGMVTQDTVLFNDTVANNIAYGSSDASLEAIKTAARKAHAEEFILEMPHGYDTVIGEHGVRMSGGQRQRLAIARAILRNPPIMILDEATSALDTQSERLVQSALDELMVARTVFVISHRLSTIINCDTILVLEEGRIIEAGPHLELLARGGLYRKLYDLQFRTDGDSAG